MGIGSVDGVHAEVRCRSQHRLLRVTIDRLAPDARPGEPHRSEADTVNRQVAPGVDRIVDRIVSHAPIAA